VGYIRLALLIVAVFLPLALPLPVFWGRVAVATLIGLSRLLDLVDGHLARKFNQLSSFGALFDLVIDLTTHTIVWILSGFYLFPLLIILEWAAGLYVAAFAIYPQTHWKTNFTKSGPGLIRAYFSNNQRNLLSAYGNLSHFIFPIALYFELLLDWVYYLCVPGLILYELVTLYMLLRLVSLSAQAEG
jgi:phosphatidylglycerophosphate synthase